MQSSDYRSGELPSFPVPRLQLFFASVCAGVLALIAVILGSASLVAGQTASAIATLSFAGFVVVTAAFAWNNQSSNSVGDSVRRWVEASTVRYDPRGLVLLGLVVALLSCMLIAFGCAAGGVVLPIFAAMGAFLATFFVPLAAGVIRNGRVELTESGIRHRGWSFESEVSWDGVIDVSFAKRHYPAIDILVDPAISIRRRNTTRFWRIETLHPGHVLELDCRRFGIHPMVLAQWIRFYIDNPTARIELGTDAATTRLAAIQR